ncbi:MAG TPA: ATP-binding protein [Actinocrinis sp.]|nr:ATP-binding protein [Actinocrinis sp.]
MTGQASAWPEAGEVDRARRGARPAEASRPGETAKAVDDGLDGPAWSPWLAEYARRTGPRRRAHLAVHPTSPRNGRHFVGAALADWRLWQLADHAMTCTSELVTNAVRHAIWPLDSGLRRVVTVTIAVFGQGVLVEVHDLDPRLPVVKPRPDFANLSEDLSELAEGGEGLRVVSGLSDRFGVRSLGTGKSIWFLLTDRGAPGNA